MTEKELEIPTAVEGVMLREGFDDGAILYNPDTGRAYGLNDAAAFIWKHLDGRRSAADIAALVARSFASAPASAAA